MFVATKRAILVVLVLPAGCVTPVVKPAAFDLDVMRRRPLPRDYLQSARDNERIVVPHVGWLGDVDPVANLTFVGYRTDSGQVRFCAVAECDPKADRLVLLPLATCETPLTVLADEGRRECLRAAITTYRRQEGNPPRDSTAIELKLSELIRERQLGPPVPRPGRIYAVAANFPSHLKHDLAIDLTGRRIADLRRARARVFLKHPPITPAGAWADEPAELLGPFDDFRFPAWISLPLDHEGDSAASTATRLDYEVEVAVVLGESLTWDLVRNASDDRIRSAVAGYVLISDTKARNPQVIDKVADQDIPLPPGTDPYRFGPPTLDRAFGFWDETTCRWWSYAASWVNCTSLGPFFVSAPANDDVPARALISARSYAPEEKRGAPRPTGRAADTLYLRQCSRLSEYGHNPDALIWSVPDVVRSILAPERNALHFLEAPARLERGDIISLGTPGGVVLTGRSQRVLTVLDALLFWWRPMDWHNAFFERDAALYLRHGDEVFYWAEGLGYQIHSVKRHETRE